MTPTPTSPMVARMRKQELKVHIDPPLMAWLRLEAKRRGVSLGDVIREALRKLMDKPSA